MGADFRNSSYLDYLKSYGLLFIIASNNGEKPYNYGIVAEEVARSMGIPTAVIALRDLHPHVSAEEDGKSATDNASLKLKEIKTAHEKLNDPTSVEYQAMQLFMRTHNLNLAPDRNNVVFYTEDSILGAPVDIFDAFRTELLALGAKEELLDNIALSKDGKFKILLDFGPIKDAVGIYNFCEALRKSAVKSGYKDDQRVPLYQEAACPWIRLGKEFVYPSPNKVSESDIVYLYAPDGLHTPLAQQIGKVLTLEEFICTIDRPNEPISDRHFQYLREESFRNLVFRSLVEDLLSKSEIPAPALLNLARTETTASHNRKPVIAQITPGLSPIIPSQVDFGGVRFESRNIHFAHSVPRTVEEVDRLLALETPGPDGAPCTPNLLVIPPHEVNLFNERLRVIATTSSAIVAQQIDPRCSARSFDAILLNHVTDRGDKAEGSYDWLRKGFYRLSNRGVGGTHHRSLRVENGGIPPFVIPGVELNSDSYFHTLTSRNEDALYEACLALSKFLLSRQVPSFHAAPPDLIYPDNKARPPGHPVALACMGADHQNSDVNRDATDVAALLAEMGMIAIWGGMTKFPGKTFMETYLSKGGIHLVASTTHDLLAKETTTGKMPEGPHERYLRRTIAPRAANDLIAPADIVYILSGGYGSLQEWAESALQGKPIIAYDSRLSGVTKDPWDISPVAGMMRCIYGKKLTHRVMRDHTACADINFFLATSKEEAADYTREVLKRSPSLKPCLV